MTVALIQFENKFRNTEFTIRHTPIRDLYTHDYLHATFKKASDIEKSKDSGEVYAFVSLDILNCSETDCYQIFGGGGNFFYFSGELEAEKVEDSDWYDVKRFEITSLNFMDRLGRSSQSLPKS